MEEDKKKLLETSIRAVRFIFAFATDMERLDAIDAIMEGYCPHCGRETNEQECYCINDD